MKALKQHYHWMIALIVFAVMLIYGGFLNAIGVFTIPVTEGLQISRGTYSLLTTTRGLAAFLSTLVTGVLFQRFGFRKCLIASLVSACAALILLGFAKVPAVLAIGYGLVGLATGTCTTSGAVFLIKSWFNKHQGMILGVVTMATGFGGSLMSTVLTDIILISSWRYAFYFGALLMGILIPVCLAVKNTPAQMGLAPYGEVSVSKKSAAAITEWPGHNFKEIVKEPQFYLMIVCTLVLSTCLYLSLNTLIPHFQDRGSSPTEAAAFYSMLMLVLSFVKLAGGWLIDRIGAKWVTVLCCVFTSVGQFLFAAAENPVLIYIGLCTFAMGLLFSTIVVPLLIVPLFGYRTFGTVNGIFCAMLSLGNMLSTPIADLLYDRIGSYSPVYTVAAVLDIVLIGLFGLLFLLCSKEKKHFSQTQN